MINHINWQDVNLEVKNIPHWVWFTVYSHSSNKIIGYDTTITKIVGFA